MKRIDELIDRTEKRLVSLHIRKAELDGEINLMAKELEDFLAKTDGLITPSKKG